MGCKRSKVAFINLEEQADIIYPQHRRVDPMAIKLESDRQWGALFDGQQILENYQPVLGL